MKNRSWAPLYTALAAAALLALSSCAVWKVNRAVELAHPSDAGYVEWFNALFLQAALEPRLRSARRGG